jgi:hypothetical protein
MTQENEQQFLGLLDQLITNAKQAVSAEKSPDVSTTEFWTEKLRWSAKLEALEEVQGYYRGYSRLSLSGYEHEAAENLRYRP